MHPIDIILAIVLQFPSHFGPLQKVSRRNFSLSAMVSKSVIHGDVGITTHGSVHEM